MNSYQLAQMSVLLQNVGFRRKKFFDIEVFMSCSWSSPKDMTLCLGKKELAMKKKKKKANRVALLEVVFCASCARLSDSSLALLSQFAE